MGETLYYSWPVKWKITSAGNTIGYIELDGRDYVTSPPTDRHPTMAKAKAALIKLKTT